MKYILICALMLSFLVSCGGGNAGTSGGNTDTSGNTNDKNEKTQCPKSTSDELPPQLPCKT